jgi:site-specific DNA-methyltransferase (adenine-specific)
MTGGAEQLANGISLISGDCLAALPELDADSFDACVTDPPYHLTELRHTTKSLGLQMQNGRTADQRAARAGFMGKTWDGGDVAFQVETWREVFRVLKPGAHLLAFGGTRTYHRMACAIEDAEFEIRDCVQWLYGSGFPKSHDVSKAIDKAAGEQRERIRGVRSGVVQGVYAQDAWSKEFKDSVLSSDPVTDDARQWMGFGTALKPACELIVLARKPLSEGTVAANILKWGTGALNIDGCRVESGQDHADNCARTFQSGIWKTSGTAPNEITTEAHSSGRWPANVIHDGSDEVVAAFPDAGGGYGKRGGNESLTSYGFAGGTMETVGYGDSGSAARFFKSCPLTEEDLRWAKRQHGDASIPEGTDGNGAGENPKAERLTANSKTDGYGSASTDQSQMDLMFITSTTTAQTTDSKISNWSNDQNTTPIINDCVKPIEPNRTEALADSVSDVSDGNRLMTSIPETQEHSEDIASNARATISRTGEKKTENIGTPITANIGGSAKRFFYGSKADQDSRLGSSHPTVKPLDLMQYLARLVTPPGGLILDPFAGTGTTGEAAFREGFRAVLIEREKEYQKDIRRRMKLLLAGSDERAHATIKEKMKDKPIDAGPLFDWLAANSEAAE